jgi:hypothetical protein
MRSKATSDLAHLFRKLIRVWNKSTNIFLITLSTELKVKFVFEIQSLCPFGNLTYDYGLNKLSL